MRKLPVTSTKYFTPVNDENLPGIVYILDKNPGVRTKTFRFLTQHGFAPYALGTVTDFVDNLGHLQPGCLLVGELDDEFDTTSLICALGHRIVEFPVVISIQQGDVVTAVQAMKLGVSDVLELPFGRDMLPAMLNSLLSSLRERLGRIGSVKSARSLVSGLSRREGEVLRHLLRGSPNKKIAHDLNLSLRTVEMHRASMMARLRAENIVDALRIAFEADVNFNDLPF